MSTSLLKTEQLELLGSDQMPDDVFVQEEARGVFTGERLAVRNREKYEAIVALLAEGIGVKRIAALLKVSVHTVQGVRDREPTAIATVKEKMAAGARSVARLCIETIRDRILDGADVSVKDLAIVTGVMVDKEALLTGQPTSIVAAGSGPSHADLLGYLAGLRTGIGAEDSAQKGSAGAPAAIDVTDQVDVGLPAIGAANDAQGQVQRDPWATPGQARYPEGVERLGRGAQDDGEGTEYRCTQEEVEHD